MDDYIDTSKNIVYTHENKVNHKYLPSNKLLHQTYNNAVIVRNSSPKLKSISKKLTQQRKGYKDMVSTGICNIHNIFANKTIKHHPYFNCDIRKSLICRHCGHRGHMDFECKLMNTSMKEQAKGSSLAFHGLTPSHKWHGTSNYNITYKMKLKPISPMNLNNNVKSKSTTSSMPSLSSIHSNKTLKQQRGIKKQRIEGQWETYTKPELDKLLKEHGVPYGIKQAFHRGTPYEKLVELAYEYIKKI